MLDVDQSVRITSEKTDHTLLRVNSDAIAISILLERRDDWPHRNVSEFADALQSIAHLAPLNRKLMFVVDVLIRASAATAKVWTGWNRAVGRSFDKIDNLSFSELLFLAHDPGANPFPINGERHEDGLAPVAPDAFAAESDVFDY